jgi:hypothetical protein
MIRIESTMLHAVSVPLRPEQGNKSPMLVIPASKGGEPGVVELAELDAVTIARLKWHYERRPNDGNAKNTNEVDENGEPRFKEIGLLRIIITDGTAPAPKKMVSDAGAAAPVAPLRGQRTTAEIGPAKRAAKAPKPSRARKAS